MEPKVHQFAASARPRPVVEPAGAAVPLSGVSLESRLREAREKRERILAEKAGSDPDGKSGPERRGNFEFGPAPFERGNTAGTDGFPFAGAGLPMTEQSDADDIGERDDPALSEPSRHGEFHHHDARSGDTGVRDEARPRPPHFSNPKIAECTSEPAETVDSSKWGLGPDDDIFINPKIVESMMPFVPYQVSGDEDPWYSASAKAKLKARQPKLVPLDPSSFIPVDESFDLGTPGELKAVLDEVTHVHVSQRKKMRLVRVIAVLVLVAEAVMVFPAIKGGFQPALEAILLIAPVN